MALARERHAVFSPGLLLDTDFTWTRVLGREGMAHTERLPLGFVAAEAAPTVHPVSLPRFL
ncbi:hypothetical protein Y886_21380 [Xanthomonas hyacinthi DSM 19077]|nr:hypothetical protein Y886_21380 [Xanthomonas hyacinthi DSM 19077]